MATIESTLLAALGKVLQPEPADFVPEVFSGRCSSPLWFVGLNPGGEGSRPTFAQLRSDPHSYADFYFNRFQGLDIRSPNEKDSHGNPLSKTVRNELMLTNEFAIGAEVPVADRWMLVMKTNRWGTHSPDEDQMMRRHQIHALDRIILPLIHQWQPAVVVVFGKAREMFPPTALTQGAEEPPLPDDPTTPLLLHYPLGYLTISEKGEKSRNLLQYFRRLGEQYRVRLTKNEPPGQESEGPGTLPGALG